MLPENKKSDFQTEKIINEPWLNTIITDETYGKIYFRLYGYVNGLSVGVVGATTESSQELINNFDHSQQEHTIIVATIDGSPESKTAITTYYKLSHEEFIDLFGPIPDGITDW